MAGADVVQVYVAAPAAAQEPPKQLEGFAKVSLAPNETRRVSIMIQPHAFSHWDTAANRWTRVPGQYGILAGDSSRNLPLHQNITVAAK
jgi:beta-glucosidase